MAGRIMALMLAVQVQVQVQAQAQAQAQAPREVGMAAVVLPPVVPEAVMGQIPAAGGMVEEAAVAVEALLMPRPDPNPTLHPRRASK